MLKYYLVFFLKGVQVSWKLTWSLFFILVYALSLSACSSVLYQPDRNLYHLPKNLGLQATEIELAAPSGNKIYAWFFPAVTQNGKTPKGTILQFHGNAENMSSHYLSLAWTINRGYNLFVFDYEGYGKSTGSPSQETTVQDGLLALKKALELHQLSNAKRFIVFGQSLGGAIAARALADFKDSSRIDYLVLDSTFYSYRRVASGFLSQHWITWPISWLPWILVSDEYSAENSLKNCKWPLLVIHDREDPIVPFDNGEKLFEIANCPKKEFWALQKGRHIGVFSADAPEYREKFMNLLGQ